MKIDKFIKSGVVGGMGLVMASKNAMAITAAHVATLGTHHLHQAEKVSEVAKVVNVENLSAFSQFVHNNPGLTIAGFGAMVGVAMGNAEIQYYPNEKKLRLRVTEKTYLHRLELISKETSLNFEELKNIQKHSHYRMKARFIEINNVEFCAKNQAKLIQAINNNQPISAKVIKKLSPNGKDIGYYVQLSFEEVIQSSQANLTELTMGIDLNQKGLAYCIVKQDGNKLNHIKSNNIQYKPTGFIQWDLENKTTEQRQWIISNKITELLAIAKSFGIYNVAIENLDFSSTINHMNSGYKSKSNKNNFNYNKMLTQFAKSQFSEMIQRKTERLGNNSKIKIYSSLSNKSLITCINT